MRQKLSFGPSSRPSFLTSTCRVHGFGCSMWEFPKIGDPKGSFKGFLKGIYKGSIKGLGFREFPKIGDPNIVP